MSIVIMNKFHCDQNNNKFYKDQRNRFHYQKYASTFSHLLQMCEHLKQHNI